MAATLATPERQLRPQQKTADKSPTTVDTAWSHGSNDSSRSVSRTMAILAMSACKTHRLAIQSRITTAGFDILDERMEQWNVPGDVDFLEAFLGNDEEHRKTWINRLSNSPIYVMVLERHRAAERWADMCGPDLGNEDDQSGVYDEDGMPVVPSGLRAQYGAAALYAAPLALSERQIAICFPELATQQALAALRAEDEEDQRASLAALGTNGGFLVREDDDIVYDEQGKAFDAHNGEPLELQQEIVLTKDSSFTEQSPEREEGRGSSVAPHGGSRVFRARPLPKNLHQATSQPRLSRAAALRMGIKLPEPPKRPQSRTSSAQTNDTSQIGISGLPKAAVALPKSLAAPMMAPRMNKSATARTKICDAEGRGQANVRERKPVDFSNTPGHKRASLGASQLASLMAPTMAPRLNKAAAARVAKAGESGDDACNTGTKGTSSSAQAAPANHRLSPSKTAASAHRALRPETSDGASTSSSGARRPVDFSNTPGHKRASIAGVSSLKSLQAPSIVPRGNRASLSRGGNVSDEQQAPSRVKAPSANSTPASSTVHARASISSTSNKENGSSGSTYQRERKPVDFSNTPGHKRTSQGAAIASLARPSIQPRSNVAAQRRLSVGGVAGMADTTEQGAAHSNAHRRPSSVLGQSKNMPGNAGRPSSRMSVGSMPGSSVPQNQKRSSRPMAPPSSFRI